MSVPVLPQYMTGFGAGYAVTGLVSGIGPLVSLATRPLSGALADRWHRKYLLMATSLLTGLTIAGYGDVEYIGVEGEGYTVFGVSVGMAAKEAAALMQAAGLDYVDGGDTLVF